MELSRLARTLAAASLCAGACLFANAAFALDIQLTASAFTTNNGNLTKDPVAPTYAVNSDGSRSVMASGSVGAYGLNGDEDHFAGVSGEVTAGAGTLRAFAHGLATNFSHVPNVPPLADALGVVANFNGLVKDSILVSAGTSALSPGDLVNFVMTLHLSGGSFGTQRVGGQFDTTSYQPGSFTMNAGAGANAAANYVFPNGLFTGVPDNLTFDVSIPVIAHVGELVQIFYSIGVGVEDRAGLWPNQTTYSNSESIVDVSNTLHVNVDAVTAGIVLSSGSGFNYSTVAAPEPTSLALLACAGALVGITALRRRR
jgi:hypothetical protein